MKLIYSPELTGRFYRCCVRGSHDGILQLLSALAHAGGIVASVDPLKAKSLAYAAGGTYSASSEDLSDRTGDFASLAIKNAGLDDEATDWVFMGVWVPEGTDFEAAEANLRLAG